MRRYTVTINGTDHVIDVEEVSADTFTVHLGDRLIDARLIDQQDLSQALITPQLEIGTERAPAAPLPSGPAPRPAGPSPSQPARPGPPAGGGDSSMLTAPMPGLILSVPVEVGTRVTRGQTVVVLEAMKMKNELRAGRDGVVSAVRVATGDQVRFGDPLVEYETV